MFSVVHSSLQQKTDGKWSFIILPSTCSAANLEVPHILCLGVDRGLCELEALGARPRAGAGDLKRRTRHPRMRPSRDTRLRGCRLATRWLEGMD